MVHRDVKPANVLLEDPASGRAFLTDFGVAKLTGGGRETKAGMFIGSVDYASPEQIEGGEIAPPVDVYALGCVLFECLTGRRPYRKNTNVAILFGHLRDPPPRVTELVADLPTAIDEVVATALAKDPAERFGSCGELAAAARIALVGEVVGAAASRAGTSARSRGGLDRPQLPEPEVALVGREIRARGSAGACSPTPTSASSPSRGRAAPARRGWRSPPPPRLPATSRAEPCSSSWRRSPMPPSCSPRLPSSSARPTPTPESLARQLADERTLLVLDNFEHVLPAAPQIAELVAAAPGLKVLVTSRAPLRVRAEREHPVPPLEPSAAAELFVERARAARPGFEPDGEDAGAIAEICARLDGLPLAIELAAARVRLLAPAAMLGRLDRRLALLTSTEQDVPSRHRTMRGTVEWSYELLDPPAQALLPRLAVFGGGWRMAAAEAVCATGPELDLYAVLDATTALVDGSLVRSGVGSDGEPRFELLQIVQEFGLYQLIERGELEACRRRHAEFYVGLAEEAEPELTGPDQVAWLGRLADETGNLRAALRFSEDAGELELGLRLAGALTRFWSVQGLMAEIRPWLARALPNAAGVAPPVRARALYAAGHAALGQGQFAEATARASRRRSSSTASPPTSAARRPASPSSAGSPSARGEVDAASASSTRSLAIAEEIGAWDVASVARSTLADLAAQRGAFPQAAELLEQSLALRRRLGDRRNVANALLGLARVELLRDDRSARATARRGGARARPGGQRHLEHLGRHGHARPPRAGGRRPRARPGGTWASRWSSPGAGATTAPSPRSSSGSPPSPLRRTLTSRRASGARRTRCAPSSAPRRRRPSARSRSAISTPSAPPSASECSTPSARRARRGRSSRRSTPRSARRPSAAARRSRPRRSPRSCGGRRRGSA